MNCSIQPQRIVLTVLVALLLNFINSAARAQNYSTTNDTDYWSNVANWDTTVPTTGGDVVLGTFNISGSTATVYLDTNYTSSNALNSLTLNPYIYSNNLLYSSGVADLVQNSSSYNMYVTSYEQIGGYDTSGQYDQSAGTNTAPGLSLGTSFDGTRDTYNLSGDSSVILTVTEEELGGGANGVGTINQMGGVNNAGELNMTGGAEGEFDQYNLSGGTLNASNETLGASGYAYSLTNDFNQTGGTNNTGELDLGINPVSGATYELSGDTSGPNVVTLNAGIEKIGVAGLGTFTQSGGVNNVEDPIALTQSPSNQLIVGDQSGSFYGYSDTAQYNLQGGILNGAYEIVGNNNSLANGDVADLNQTGGTNNAIELDLGENTGSVGTYELSGGVTSTLTATNEIIGNQGMGTLTQSDSTSNTITGDLTVGNQSGSNGTYNISGGAQLQTGTAEVAALPGSTGSVNVDGSGSHFEANTLSVGGSANVAGGQGSFTLTNGSTAHVAVKVSTGINGTIDVKDNGGGGLTIGSTDTLAANGTVQVNSGGTLGGSGTVTGNVVNNYGTVAPGDPAMLTINGDYTQTGGLLVLDIAGPNSYDQLNVEGKFTVAMGATLELNFIDGFAPTTGETFADLIDYQSIDGTFSNVVIGGLALGFNYTLNPSGGGGTDFELTSLNDGVSLSETPEPSTYALFLLGGGLLFLARGRITRSRRST